MSREKMMIKGDQNKQIFGDLTENHYYFYGLTEQQAKQALTEYTEEQLQMARQRLFKERWRVSRSPFSVHWVWVLLASAPVFVFSVGNTPRLLGLLDGELISSLSDVLLVAGILFTIFLLFWNYTANKMKFDIEAINQLLRQNWQMKRWIDEELQARRLQYWKAKCGVRDELKDYMEQSDDSENR
ncbi:MAG: hypothetical protein Q4A60_06530 [Pasteurellaceae bacterium]|nr:hypothetical protein [Pasteurellaceae bacterium]